METALKREMLEELGLKVEDFEKIGEAPFIGADGIHRQLHYFLIATPGQLTLNNHHKWLPISQESQMPFPKDQEILDKLSLPK